MRNKLLIGIISGAVLGALDGLSAWFVPEARTMLATIVVGSTVKGVITGGIAGWAATRWRSMPVGIAVGVIAGLVLSSLAAMGQADHFWEIVAPGTLVGLITGVLTQRYPRAV